MFIFRFFVPEGDADAGGNMGGQAAGPTNEAPAADAGDGEEVETGGTTPEEVASILRSSGMNVPTPKAEEKGEDDANDEQEADAGDAGGVDDNKPHDAGAADATKSVDGKDTKSQEAAPEEEPSFKLEVEDADGNKYQIESVTDLPEDFQMKNDRQGLEILDQLRELRDSKKEYDKTKAEETATATRAENVAKIQESWNQEIKSLQADKRITASADPSKNERVDQIFKFMGEENNKRSEAGRPLIATIEDALNALEIKEGREAKAAAAVKAKEDAKRGGSLVGGSSAPASTGTPAYRAGSARNANEAIRQAGLLR